MDSRVDMPDNEAAVTFQTFYNMLTCSSLHRGEVNDVIYDAKGAHVGLYRCTRRSLYP